MKIAIILGNDLAVHCDAQVVSGIVNHGDDWLPGVRVVGDAPSLARDTAEYAMNDGRGLFAAWWPGGDSWGEPDFNIVGCGIPSVAPGDDGEIYTRGEGDIKAFVVTEASRSELESTQLIGSALVAGSQVHMADGRVFTAGNDGVLTVDDAHRSVEVGLGEYGGLDLLCMEESTDFRVSFDALGIALAGVSKNAAEIAGVDRANVVQHGSHVGKVLDVSDGIVTQKVNREGATVLHAESRLTGSVAVGDVVEIKYQGGIGQVGGKEVGVERGR